MILTPFFQLARQRYYWSPPRLFRILWAILTNIGRQFQVFRVLAPPVYQGLVLTEPGLPFKYLSHNYLARGFSVAEREASFVHHYRLLHSRLSSPLLRQMLFRELTVFEIDQEGARYSITLGLSRNDVREGELYLKLNTAGATIAILQFTIVPGWVVQSAAADVILVSRLQGMKGHFKQIYHATKALYEVAPPALLLAALQGIASALEIRELAGVCAASQFSYTEEHAAIFKEAYDQFFIQLGAVRSSAMFYSSPLPVEEKPVEQVKRGHKIRTKRKRAFKLAISEQVGRIFCESL